MKKVKIIDCMHLYSIQLYERGSCSLFIQKITNYVFVKIKYIMYAYMYNVVHVLQCFVRFTLLIYN